MSYFSNALDQVLKTYSATDLATASGLSQGIFSRYRTGDKSPRRDNLEAIINAIPTVHDQWILTRAYIMDVTPRAFLSTIVPLLQDLEFEPAVLEASGKYHTDKAFGATLEQIKLLAAGDDLFKKLIVELARRW